MEESVSVITGSPFAFAYPAFPDKWCKHFQVLSNRIFSSLTVNYDKI
jgi:hypothetical protein